MATTYLTRTPGSAGNRKTWTYSAWIKRGKISDTTSMFSAWSADSIGSHCVIQFDSNDLLDISTWSVNVLTTTAKYRDPSAWYHIVMAVDTTQTTASDRVKFYVNGEQVTSFSNSNYPAEDFEFAVNNSVSQTIGSNNYSSNTSFWNGSMANVEMVDGQQLTPAYFGSTDTASGIWTPQASSTISSYGTNGFKLKMDTTSPGADTSGNTNTFTVGAGTPTLTQGSPSNVFCIMNPIVYSGTSGQPVFSNGNTTVGTTTGGWKPAFGSIGVTSGKWYFETKIIGYNHCVVGIANETGTYNTVTSGFPPSQPYSYGIVCYDLGKKETNNSRTVYGSQTNITDGQIIGTAIDLDNNKLYWSVNGVFKNSGDPTSGSTGTGSAFSLQAGETYFPMVVGNTGGGSNPAGGNLNFGEGFFGTTAAGTEADDNGQGLFAYDVPAGYYALNTKNLEAYG